MPFLIVALLTAAQAAAVPEGACEAALGGAAAQGDAFDLAGALDAARAAGACDAAAGTVEYLEGLLGAREAVKQGGTIDSLRDVRSAANALSRRAEAGNRRWEAASLAMRAVAAASQDERGEMSIYLAEAIRIEGLLLTAGEPAAPIISVHELAGDLWLQVDRFADARAAYERAAERVGRTPRVRLGLARAAKRLDEAAVACEQYRGLLEWWGARTASPPEIQEAREYVESQGCTP
jgi:hypothetical protein